MFIGSIGIIAGIHGTSLIVPSFNALLSGWLMLLLLSGIVLGAGFKILFDLRFGYSLSRSLVEVAVFGIVTYALIFGGFWLLNENVVKSDKSLFNFQLPATPTPSSLVACIFM
jgi:hypothetical protein